MTCREFLDSVKNHAKKEMRYGKVLGDVSISPDK
jgi:hypothetical protein